MKEIVLDFREKMQKDLFKDEQHVRISLVARICSALGWDIWNPAEFYTEYPVKKYPNYEVTQDARGKVDVALFLAEKRSESAEVYIEIKTPRNLDKALKKGEEQLQKYNFWDKSAISILTDGIVWRFYLPSLGGTFETRLFAQINLLADDLDLICKVFDRILKRDNYRKKAIEAADDMFEELRKIQHIQSVKGEAEQISRKTGDSIYSVAQKLLRTNESIRMELEEIKNLWDRNIPSGQSSGEPNGDEVKDKATPRSVLISEIIKALESVGGRGSKKDIHKIIERNMSGRFTKKDLSIDKAKQITWEHQVDWARLEMSNKGMIKKNSPRGIWELTKEYKDIINSKLKK